MAIRVSDIAVVFDEFTFGFEKKTFPKVRARTSLTASCLSPAECDECPTQVRESDARATISATFNAEVNFKMSLSKSGELAADDVSADITIEETPIEVLAGKHK